MDKIFGLFTAKKSIRAELEKVQIKDGYAVATDSFKLIKLEVNDIEIAQLKALETLGKVKLTKEDDIFPEVDRVIPDEKELEKEYQAIKLSPVFLAQVADAMKRMDSKGLGDMTMYVPKVTTKPVVFKNKKAIALLMPIFK